MTSLLKDVRALTRAEWRFAGILFAAQLAFHFARVYLLPTGFMFFPSAAVALTGLFFGGVRFWPVVLAAAVIGGIAGELALTSLIMFAIGQTVQATLGAYLLRAYRFDPLFRRYRDTFFFLLTIVLISTILPILITIGRMAGGIPFPTQVFGYAYMAMLTSLLVLAPFLLRWLAKPRFNRTPSEWIELGLVFVLLLGIASALFIFDIATLFGIPLLYFFAVPFFWIALRHRPRWLSTALLLTAVFAIGGELAVGDPTTLPQRLYEIEALLVLIGMSFFTIVSIEEDRRVNTNIMRSQLSSLENAVARISSESKAKNDFIAILAHELRNPLAPVVTSIELLKLKGGRDAEDTKALSMMEERMEAVKRLLDDLLDISRISEGKVTLKRETLDLESVIRRALLSTDHYFKERHQTLVVKFPKKRKYVLGDPLRLEQVFSNLLTNASKYSNSGTTVTLVMQRMNDEIVVSIADEGIGIPVAELESVFTPFHQLPGSGRAKKGIGIGLALVKSFVNMHGGTVYAESRGEGTGSTFTVRLPLLPEKQGQPVKTERSVRSEPPAPSGLSVLVVDDNDAAAAGIGRLLELRGCLVSYAYDGRQALEKVDESAPSAVLLDVGLPDQDGYTVATTLRERGYQGRLIALTGFSTEDAKERGKEAGFDHYLIKPAGLADLKRVLPEIA